MFEIEDIDEIRTILALILSNQALIMSSLSCLPGMPHKALKEAGEVNIKRAAAIEKEIRRKVGLEHPVS